MQEHQLCARVAVLYHLFLILRGAGTIWSFRAHRDMVCHTSVDCLLLHSCVFCLGDSHDAGSQTLLSHWTCYWCFTIATVHRERLKFWHRAYGAQRSKFTLSTLFPLLLFYRTSSGAVAHICYWKHVFLDIFTDPFCVKRSVIPFCLKWQKKCCSNI